MGAKKWARRLMMARKPHSVCKCGRLVTGGYKRCALCRVMKGTKR